jgi:MFS family permease
MFFRALVGLGLGGEWSAGAVLVAESWPAENRAKAISLMQSGWALGYMLAAGLGALILPRYGWRVLFLVGVLPALMTLFIRRKVEEPELWKKEGPRRSSVAALFRPPLRRGTVLASLLATVVLFAYWGLFTWLPGFLSAPVEQGGAGFNIVKTGGWVIAMQMGAFFGYLTFGWMADRFGRRPAFAVYVAMAGLLVPAYGLVPRWGGENSGLILLAMGPLIGFFGTGFFSLFGTILAELYPTEVRGAGQGFAYNFGRGLSALAPFAVGKIADSTGVGPALAINSGFFLLGAVLVFTLPETKNTDLSRVG